MRKLILALTALACLVVPAGAQQAPTVNVGNFPPIQPVSGTVTANVGTTNGLALDASVQSVKTALGSPFQAGGNIGNAAFGISGTLPAFAAPPTVNLGTLNGAATAANQVAALTAAQRFSPATEATFTAIAASSPLYGTVRTVPSNAARINLWAGCSQAGATLYLQGSNDNFGTTAMIVSSLAIPASSAVASGTPAAAGASLSGPATFVAYRAWIANGSTAGNCTLYSSFTSN